MKTLSKFPRILLQLVLATALAMTLSLRAADAPTFKIGDFTFTRPDKWETAPVATPMRAAQFKVSSTDGKSSAEVAFFQFGPGGAGGVKANVDRWLNQFVEPRDQIKSKVEEVMIGKTKVTYVQAEGTFSSGMPGGPMTPMADYGLMGAILGNEGDNLIFIKMTGPKGLVQSATADFKKMVESGLKN
jgi:hypothetical protein